MRIKKKARDLGDQRACKPLDDEPILPRRPRHRKESPELKPWTCEECGATVHVDARLHGYVCSLYRERRRDLP